PQFYPKSERGGNTQNMFGKKYPKRTLLGKQKPYMEQ
ncbi:unnamed protein product, partial [marine sediment metagenome]